MNPYVIAFTIAISAWGGWQVNDYKRDAEVLALKEELEEKKRDLSDRQFEVEMVTAENEKLIADRQREVNREILDFNSECELSSDWVRIHNSALSASRASPGESDATDSRAASDRDALQTITENYHICQNQLNKLDGLQKWVAEIYK